MRHDLAKIIHRIALKHLEKKTLDLGYVGENEHTQVVIDCSEVLWEYPNASFEMVVQPPSGALYPVTLTKSQYDLIWDITASDLVYAGNGQLQLTFTDDGEIIRSAIGSTYVRRSLEATGDAPTPLDNWMERANAELEAIETMSEATSSDVGKALSPKTVEDGHVTEWQFKTIGGGGGSGTSDYDDLDNKPSINGVSLFGNKTTANLGIHEIPSGGSQGQFLGKTSNSNYDIGWVSQDKSYANLTGKPKINNVELTGNKSLDDLGAAAKAGTVLDTTLSRGRRSGMAVGTGSFAFGFNVAASSDYSHAEGAITTASGWYSHAEGASSTASATAAHAEGTGSVASDSSAHAEGQNTTASKYSAHSEGRDSEASGVASHAEGVGTAANHKAQHVFGEYNERDNSSETAANRGNYVEIVGNGTSNNARSNARTLDWDGNEVLSGDLTVNKGTSSEVSVGTLKTTVAGKYTKPSGGIPASDLAEDYIQEPATEGTSGQVLTTDGNGGRTWTTVQGGGGSFTPNYVTPEQYGASGIGDQSHDDTSAMSDAFSSGLPVVLTKGRTYYISQIDVTVPLFVYGNGATIITKAATSAEYSSGGHRMIICENSAKQVHIQDVNFVTTVDETVNGAHGTRDDPIPRRSMRSAIAFYGIDRLELIGCTFTNFDDPILGQRSGSDSTYANICKNAWIKDCQIHNSLMGIIGYYRNLTVEGCEIVEDANARSGEHGLYLFTDTLEACAITGTTVRTNYVPDWQPNTNYIHDTTDKPYLDSYVKYGPYDVYHCTETHTSESSFDATKWELVSGFNGSCGSCIQFYPSSLSATLPACEKREYLISGCNLIGDAYISLAGPANVYATACNMRTVNYRADTRRRSFECEFVNGGKIEVYGSSVNMELMDAVNDGTTHDPRMNVIFRNSHLYAKPGRSITDRFGIYRAYDCTFDNIGLSLPTNAEIVNCTFSSTSKVPSKYYLNAPSTTTNAKIVGCLFNTGSNVNNIAYGCVGTCNMVACISALPTPAAVDNTGLTVAHMIDFTDDTPTPSPDPDPGPEPSDNYETIATGLKTVMKDEGDDYSYILFNNTPNTITAGEEYKVMFTDISETYVAVAKSVSVDGSTRTIFGNPGVIDPSADDDSGLDFMGFMYNSTTLVIAIPDPPSSVTKINATIQKKITE